MSKSTKTQSTNTLGGVVFKHIIKLSAVRSVLFIQTQLCKLRVNFCRTFQEVDNLVGIHIGTAHLYQISHEPQQSETLHLPYVRTKITFPCFADARHGNNTQESTERKTHTSKYILYDMTRVFRSTSWARLESDNRQAGCRATAIASQELKTGSTDPGTIVYMLYNP